MLRPDALRPDALRPDAPAHPYWTLWRKLVILQEKRVSLHMKQEDTHEATMYIQEEFVIVNVPMATVENAMTDEHTMRRWMSPAVQFWPLDGWQFDEGARWQLGLTGLGKLLTADYVVHERREGLILWQYTGFWHGFDAWHWFALPQNPDQQTVIQNRLEYTLDMPLLDVIWPYTFVPLMDWDARLQMQRLKTVCETLSTQEVI